MFLLVLAFVNSFANPCLDALEEDFKSIIRAAVKDKSNPNEDALAFKRFLYTGKDLSDLGHWSSCTRLEKSTYLLFDLKQGPSPLYIGLCVPSECTAQAFSEIFARENPESISVYLGKLGISNEKLKAPGLNYRIFAPQTYSLGAGGVITLLFCFLLLGFIVAGTYFDYASSAKKREETVELEDKTSINASESLRPPKKTWKYLAFFQCFSLIRNWNSMFYQPIKDSTRIFDGVRAMSVGWVILAHVYITRLTSVSYNYEEVPYIFQSFLGSFFYSAGISVASFFWISGFLFSFLMAKEADTNNGRLG